MILIIINLCLIVLASILIILIYRKPSHENEMLGGSRTAIFSRFNYTPDFPMISQFDQVDYNRFSKVYNISDPIKFISGRPYKFYHTADSTWLNPWTFPQEINKPCLQRAMNRCNEHVVMLKSEEDKLGGLSISTPKDIVRVTPCFDQVYEQCQKKN
jgi:hypothetical protein